MARGQHNEQGAPVFLRIAEGKIVESVNEGQPGAIKRTTKPSDEHPNGREVWERRDDYVDGVITSLYRKERDFKGETMRSIVIRLRDKDEHYQVELNEGNRYWASFLLRLPNVNMGKSIRISPYDFNDKEGRRVIGLNLFQDGKKVDPKWTKTDPGDLPQGRQVRVNGKDVWDFEARDRYLIAVMEEIADQLRVGDTAVGGGGGESVTSDPSAKYAPPGQVADNDDDLPF